VLLFGLVGMALGVWYSLAPVQLSYRGLGELAVGIGFGILPVMGAAWLQSGELTLEALVVSLPITFWVIAILLINEVPDSRADGAAGRRTLVVRLGVKNTRWLYLLLNGLALVAAIGAVAMGMLPAPAAAVPVLLMLVAAYAARGIGGAVVPLRRSIELTLMIHAVGGLWMSGWILGPM
jgi:1,4-dihydroxy-2-naphthoate octaprenyltransferase